MSEELPRLVLCEENGRDTFRVGAWVCPACILDCETSHYGIAQQFVYLHRRALVRFENGWALSIVWGPQTYSENYHWAQDIGGPIRGTPGDWLIGYPIHAEFIEEPRFVEIAVMLPDRFQEPGIVITGPNGEEVGRVQLDILDNSPMPMVPVTAIPKLVMAFDRIGTGDLKQALAICQRILNQD